ncbi:MAG: TRAP transporter substrate-binding protein DctP [Defluviicoccus sp.]|nr:TRAP transporter substrate-binding protein DctP [Defluviicoccus sp.]
MGKLLTAGVLAAALAAASAGAAGAKELLFSIIGAPKHVMNAVMFPQWTKGIEDATGGKVKLKILLKSVAPPPRLYDATTQGVTDSAVIMNAFIQRRAPLVQISMLPFLFADAEAHAVALWRTQRKFFDKAKTREYADVQLLGFTSGMGGQICSLKQPIQSLDYMRKLKLWSLPGGAAKTLSALNVAVVPGPAVRMYPIVSKGTVDGWASLPVMDAYTFNILDVTKSCTLLEGGLGQATFSIMMNKDTWNGLTRTEQQQIMSASGEKLARTSRHWQALSSKQRADFVKAGKQVVDAPPDFLAALRRAARPQHDQWIAMANGKGIDGKAAYDYFVEQARTAHK